jgi:hypothetical protein
MLVLSATQAIAPALERTKNLLFRPFRWGTFLKLCAVAVFTEGFSGNFNFSHQGRTTHTHIDTAPLGFHFNPGLIAALVFIGIAVVVLAIVLFYLAIRLRFALFECLIHQTKLIAPGWRKYRFQAFRFFLLSIAIGIVSFVVLAAILLPFAFGFFRIYRETQLGRQFPVAETIALILPLIPIFFLIVLAAIAVDLILRDFMLPHFALENASAGQAWAAVRDFIGREMGAFFLYALLRILLPIAALIALFVVLAIPGLIVFGMLGVILAALHAALHDVTTAVMVVGAFFEVFLGLLIAILALFLAVSFGGPLCIAIRNYALLFYGGRYLLLGNILYPPLPPPPPVSNDPGIA